MATSDKPTTNGEFYDHERRQWYVMCGADAVPIRKVDASGKDVVPEKPPDARPVLKVLRFIVPFGVDTAYAVTL